MSAPRLFDRSVIRLSPTEDAEDVRGFLQGLVTQDTKADLPLWGGLLTPQGKALFDFFLWADEAGVLIDCEADQVEALVRRLSMYRLRRKITISVDTTLGVFWAMAAEQGVADPRLAVLGVRWLAPVAGDDADVSAFYRNHRLSLGVTEGVAELGSDATLWLEANAAELNGVSFTKGCYVGQENTARMNWRQKVNRRLLVVPIGQADHKRLRIAYPDLGLAVVQARVEDVPIDAWPAWLRSAISQPDDGNSDA
ncbi:MAG: folate-binding protein [Sphingorhabdus sp.]